MLNFVGYMNQPLKNVFFLFSLLLLSYNTIEAQNVRVIKITDLEKRIKNTSDTTYIVNFWATWCAPCVKELPDFEKINAEYKGKKTVVLLVTLDFKEDLDKKVIPFVKTKELKSEVMLLYETNANYFIPKITNDWTGAIPATYIVNNSKKVFRFFEKKLTYEFLKTEIESILKL